MRQLLLVLSLLLLTPSWVSAQSPWQPKFFTNISGGLDDGFDPIAIEDNEASDLQNVVFNTGGAVVKRGGSTKLNASALSATAAFTGLTFYKQSDGTRFLVSTVIDGATSNIYDMPYGGGTSGPTGTWASITGSLTLTFKVDNHADFALAQNSVVITDGRGVNPPYRWTGTGNAALLAGSPVNAAWVEFHKNILWLAGDTANPSRVTFSNIGDITTWTSTDFLNIETNDGQIVRGMKSALDCLYVFKDFSIWRVCGSDRDTVTQEQMVRGIGTLCNNGIQLINNQFIFPTAEGQVAVYDGGVNVQIISNRVQGTIAGLNQNRFDTCESAAVTDGSGNINYYLAFTNAGSSQNNLVLIYDTAHHAWTKFLGMKPNAMATFEVGTQSRSLMFGDYAGLASQYPSGNSDNGTAINAYWTSKQYSFPDIPQDKTWRVLESFLTQTGAYTMTVTTRSDFESPGTATVVSLNGTGAVWDTAVWDTDSWSDLLTTINRIEVNKRRRFFQLKYSDNSSNPAFTVKGFVMWVEPEGRI